MVTMWCHLCWGVNIKVSPLTHSCQSCIPLRCLRRSLTPLCLVKSILGNCCVAGSESADLLHECLKQIQALGGDIITATELLPHVFSHCPVSRSGWETAVTMIRSVGDKTGQLMKTFMARASWGPGVPAQHWVTLVYVLISQKSSL